MKKLVTLVSITFCIGFAIALANAEDTSAPKDSGTEALAAEQAGTAAPLASADSAKSESKETTKTTKTEAKNSKSCTNDSGTTLYRGDKGFKQCLQAMKKGKHSEQMSGTAQKKSSTKVESETVKTPSSQ